MDEEKEVLKKRNLNLSCFTIRCTTNSRNQSFLLIPHISHVDLSSSFCRRTFIVFDATIRGVQRSDITCIEHKLQICKNARIRSAGKGGENSRM